jgi:hypothetical protein
MVPAAFAVVSTRQFIYNLLQFVIINVVLNIRRTRYGQRPIARNKPCPYSKMWNKIRPTGLKVK